MLSERLPALPGGMLDERPALSVVIAALNCRSGRSMSVNMNKPGVYKQFGEQPLAARLRVFLRKLDFWEKSEYS